MSAALEQQAAYTVEALRRIAGDLARPRPVEWSAEAADARTAALLQRLARELAAVLQAEQPQCGVREAV